MGITGDYKTKFCKSIKDYVTYHYYRCTKKNKIISCSQPHISESDLDLELTSHIKKYSLSKDWARSMYKMVDDNLKNIVQSGGGQFYVVDMAKADIDGFYKGVSFWTPVYVNATDLDKLINWKQTNYLMVKEFEALDMQIKSLQPIGVPSAERYLNLRMAQMEERKLTPKEKTKLVNKAAR